MLWPLMLAFGAGAVTVSIGAWVAYAILAPRLEEASTRAHESTERLLAAWNAGVRIPELPGTGEPDVEPAPDPWITEWLEQWDEAGRAVYAQKARQLARTGLSGPEVVAALDRQRAGILS